MKKRTTVYLNNEAERIISQVMIDAIERGIRITRTQIINDALIKMHKNQDNRRIIL